MTRPEDAPQAIACPSIEVIQAFAQGQMSHRDLSAVDRHLDSCPKCQARLATVAPAPDSLLDRLRRARGSSDTPADPAIEALMAGARHLPYAAMAAPTLHFPGYRIVGKLGEGGCGTVYKVFNESMGGRLEALKTLKDPGDRHLHERLRQEIRAIAQLEHPNIIRAYHTGTANGLLFFTMELAAGCNLFELVQERRRGPLAPAEACALVAQAAEGLQHAHDKQIIHRDVKPGNLLLTDQGVVKVLDLGLARLLELTTVGEPLTGGASPGTPRYMAPEQAEDAHSVDHRADIYGLGCTLSFLLTARHPTPGVPLAVPPNLGQVLERMLARDPNQRFDSARAVIEALRPFDAPGAVVAGLPAAPRPIVVVAAPASTVGHAAQSTVGHGPPTARKPRVIAAPTAVATPVRAGPAPAVPAEPTSANGAAAPPVPADGMQHLESGTIRSSRCWRPSTAAATSASHSRTMDGRSSPAGPQPPANPVVCAGSGSSAGGERTCPMCSEPIKADAKRCKHCGETLDVALRKAEEVERLAMSNRGGTNVNVNTNVVASARSGGGSSTNVGANVALEVLGGFFSIFGIGHFCNGNVGLGLLFMLSYWFLQFINVILMIVFIGFITFPLTWIAYMIISPIVVAATPPRR